MVNPCALTDLLSSDYAKAIRMINRKFAALRRLGEILEQLGDLSFLVPDISKLIPVYMIDLSAYASLVAACPFLKLPKEPGFQDIQRLQALVANAYARITNQLMKHPWFRMGKLQDQMDKLQGQLNGVLSEGQQYVQCLQQACNSVSSVVTDITATNWGKEFDQFARDYTANNGRVLTQGMDDKRSQVQGAVESLNELSSPAPFANPSNPVQDTPRVPQFPQLPPEPPLH
jgi:hypothetical protein